MKLFGIGLNRQFDSINFFSFLLNIAVDHQDRDDQAVDDQRQILLFLYNGHDNYRPSLEPDDNLI